LSDLIAEIKSRLSVQDLVGRSYALVPRGGKLQAKDHDSLTVDVRKQVWSWFSQPAGSGQKVCGGDLLDWISYTRFGRTKAEGDQFAEVLREACALAGVEFPDRGTGGRGDGERQQRLALEREKRSILEAYMEVARSLWNPTRLQQAKQRKGYLTPEVVERWGLGIAPTFEQCLKFRRTTSNPTGSADNPEGERLTEKQLRLVGLLRDGRDESSYMHFSDCIVIPWMDGGEVVYITSRRLRDMTITGEELDKKRKSLSMFAPGADGTRGMVKPAGFNLDTLRQGKRQDGESGRRGDGEILLVEGPLDAIACEEAGHAAIAMGCASPTEALSERLGYYPQMTLYLALDGTSDVTALSRATAAGALGLYTRICVLPDEKDPDDMAGEDWERLKGEAVDALTAWCELVAN
jgi:DNA primase